MDKIIEHVKNNIYTYNLIQDGDVIVVGVSGGPDSVFLLHALNYLKDTIKKEKNITYTLHVAHVNHKIREEAINDANWVRKYCNEFGLSFHLLEFDVNTEAARLKIGTEECGRKIRYEFFNNVLKEVNGTKIAVAHNAGDNAETIILNFLRGAGITGLSGMEYNFQNIIRPILDINKQEILEYLDKNSIKYVIDRTNLTNDYTRNKVRNDLINKIENEYNPNIINTLNRMSKINKLDNEIIVEAVENAYLKLDAKKDNGKIIIDTKIFNSYSQALQYRLVRRILQELNGNVQNVEMVHIKDTCELINASITGKQYILGNKYKVIIEKKNMAVFVSNA